ncbi:MAG: hypothetical protein IMZ44_16160, partial [Planctomycetes bacterium]|nr:hypothetical protein [Planctomycetota bacterium]
MRERLSVFVAICLLLAAGLAAPARAGDVNWQHPATLEGDWFAPENWGSLAVPTVSDSAYIDNGGTACITTGTATACYAYAGYNVSGTVRQSGGSNVIRGQAYVIGGQTYYDGGDLYLGYQPGAVGTYELGGTGVLSAAASEYIGFQGSGTFRQTGGKNTVAVWLCIAGMPTAGGVYELGGTAELSANAEYVGLYGPGAFTQSGGVNTVTATLFIGGMSSLDSSYTLTSGQVSSGSTYVGFGGSGTFTQSGGRHTVTNELVVGYQAGSVGTYGLSGADAILSVTDEHVGYQSQGTFRQDGGTHTVTGRLSISALAGGSGVFILSGGTLTTGSVTNNGTFTQSGGAATVGNVDGTGTLSVGGDGGPTLTAKQIRQSAITIGTVPLAGGASLTAADVTVDVFNLNAGTASVTSLTGSGSHKTALIDVGTTLTASAGVSGLTTLTVNGSVVASDGTPSPTYRPVAANTIMVASTGSLTAGATAANHFMLNGVATVTSLTGADAGSLADIPVGKTLTANGLVSSWSTLQVNGVLNGTGAVSVGAGTLGGTGIISGPVLLTGDSTLTSTGTLTLNNTLTVSGEANQLPSGTILTGGNVTIDPGAVFIINGTLGGAGTLIVRGTLMGKGTIGKAVSIEAGGTFSPGSPSSILTAGQVLNAETPQNFSFEIGAPAPDYTNPASSANDVLRLTSETLPFADAAGDDPASLAADTVIDVYFLFNDPPAGEYKAEFFAATDFTDAVAGATYQYWRLDPRGERLHNGN